MQEHHIQEALGADGSAVRTNDNSKDKAESGYENGGQGGQGNSNKATGDNGNYSAGGGAGNPGGYNEKDQHKLSGRAPTGTGGLLIIYAGTFNNQNEIVSKGTKRRRGSCSWSVSSRWKFRRRKY